MGLERKPEPAQQHRDVSALRAVVGVEFVEHQVLQRFSRQPPHVGTARVQQHMVEHLVVGEQDVGWRIVHEGTVGDQPVSRDAGTPAAALLAGVQPGRDRSKCRVTGDQLGEALSLVVGERVHRVEDQRLHSGDAGLLRAQHMIENREQERLGLTRTGAGRDQGRLRPFLFLRRKSLEGARLMPVWSEGVGHPIQMIAPPLAGWRKRQAQPHIRPLEHAVGRITDEVGEHGLGVRIG